MQCILQQQSGTEKAKSRIVREQRRKNKKLLHYYVYSTCAAYALGLQLFAFSITILQQSRNIKINFLVANIVVGQERWRREIKFFIFMYSFAFLPFSFFPCLSLCLASSSFLIIFSNIECTPSTTVTSSMSIKY